MTARLAVLVSGNGSNLQAIIDACDSSVLDAQVVGVVSNTPDAFALHRAARCGIATAVVRPSPAEQRCDYDARLGEAVAAWHPDLVVLAGFMRILSKQFIDCFPNRLINLHPALPGQLAGTDAIGRAYGEFVDGRRTGSGVMVHLVPDEGVDTGPVVASEPVPILRQDTLEQFAERMHATEHRVLVRALQILIDTRTSSQQKVTGA